MWCILVRTLTTEEQKRPNAHSLAIHRDVLLLPQRFLRVIVDNRQFGIAFSMFFLLPILVLPVMIVSLPISVFMFLSFMLTAVIFGFFLLVLLFPFVA